MIPARLLTEEVERQSAAARERGMLLRLDLDAPGSRTARALCNGFELQQMIAEVLENCFKYASGSQVDLSVAARGSVVDVVIRDHGPGLPAAELEAATERFWRAETSRQSPGTGLGMAIVDRLVRANGGELLLEIAAGGDCR